MPDAANAIFPGGPSNKLGNERGPTLTQWKSLSKDEQASLEKSARLLKDGPELNKFDEALSQYGTVRLPAGSGDDDPRRYLNFPNNLMPPSVERIDHPDGSVILRQMKQDTPTS